MNRRQNKPLKKINFARLDSLDSDNPIKKSNPSKINVNRSNADLYLLLRGGRIFRDEAPKTQKFLDIQSRNIINRIQEKIPDVDAKLIRILITYARSLPQEGKQVIDDTIFKAQLEKHFNLTDEQMLDRMKSVLSPEPGVPKIYIEDYVRLLCIFSSNLIHVKVDFVFAVYNARADEHLTPADLRFFMRPMVRFASSSLSDSASMRNIDLNQHEIDEENLDEVVDLFIQLVDRNGDKNIDKDEFTKIVEKDRLMMTCLGQCLPEDYLMNKFNSNFIDITGSYKTAFEVQALFRTERRRCLKGLKPKNESLFKELYPVDLEMHV